MGALHTVEEARVTGYVRQEEVVPAGPLLAPGNPDIRRRMINHVRLVRGLRLQLLNPVREGSQDAAADGGKLVHQRVKLAMTHHEQS